MKLLWVIALLWITLATVPWVHASWDCSSKKWWTTEVLISNEYKKEEWAYKKDMYKNKKSTFTMDMIKTRLGTMSVETLEMVQSKMDTLKEKVSPDHPKYYVFSELEIFINGLVWTKSASGTIVDVAISDGWFPTLIAAVQAAWLVETLQWTGPFTVFAPTEEAFAALLVDLWVTAEELLADTELLTTVLTYHVLPWLYQASDVVWLAWATDIATVQWSTVSINPNWWTPTINDSNIIATDVFGSNGIIHVIDKVLLP